ncbi:MAG TPA: hypothetical protein VG796_12495 [Verrucomicrobiales bacterium]|jgi:hypothetical protein|nr:hypothetical protein [Verrucomicrobiales bacterium]
MKRILIIVGVVVVLAGIGIYFFFGALMKAASRGDAAVAALHRAYNANDTAAIHASASPAFREAVPLEKFTPFIDNLRQKLGEWKNSERTSVNLKTTNGKKFLELTCSATFAKGEGTEEFAFDYDGDEPLLIRYFVQSPALIDKSVSAVQGKEGESKTPNP